MINRSGLKSVAALPLSARQLTSASLIAITPDGFGIAGSLARQLVKLGYNAQLVENLPETCDVAVLLDAWQPFHSQDQALAINPRIFSQIQRIAPHFSQHGGLLFAVEDCGGQFGLTAMPGFAAWAAGVSGLIKTAAQEWPQAQCRVVDLQRADQTNERLAARLLAEIMTAASQVEIGLPADGRRITLSQPKLSHPCDLDPGNPCRDDGTGKLQENAVLLVTGGARGVTAACLLALAQQKKLRLVLLGRTAVEAEPELTRNATSETALKQALFADYSAKKIQVTPKQIQAQVSKILSNREIAATIHGLEGFGSTVEYLAVDVLNLEALAAAVATIRQRWGSIDGIVHGAGVLADKLITEKTAEQFSLVFNTKVLGLKNLLAVTAQDNLQLLVLFSSVAGRFGNPGQSDYAMANEVLNKVAQQYQREHPQCRVKSINWGPWEGGMVTEQIKQLFAQRGVAVLPVADGARMFVEELSAEDGVEIVIGGELPTVKESSALISERVFTVSQHSHPFLIDHTVQDIPVLPACFALEWFVATAKQLQPQLPFVECRNFRVLRGIPLKDFYQQPQEFLVRCQKKTPDPHVFALSLYTKGQPAPHYSAEILLSQHLGQPDTSSIDLSQAEVWPYALDVVYKHSDQEPLLFHGPQFQALTRLDSLSDRTASADIKGLKAMGWPGQWETDALAIDAVFQIGRLWGQRILGRRSLPTAFASMRLFAPAPSPGSLHCQLFNCRTQGNFQIIVDALITDSHNRIYAEFTGIEGVCYDL